MLEPDISNNVGPVKHFFRAHFSPPLKELFFRFLRYLSDRPRQARFVRNQVDDATLHAMSGSDPCRRKETQNRIICPFLPPRIFVKCPSIRKVDVGAVGDRKLNP